MTYQRSEVYGLALNCPFAAGPCYEKLPIPDHLVQFVLGSVIIVHDGEQHSGKKCTLHTYKTTAGFILYQKILLWLDSLYYFFTGKSIHDYHLTQYTLLPWSDMGNVYAWVQNSISRYERPPMMRSGPLVTAFRCLLGAVCWKQSTPVLCAALSL